MSDPYVKEYATYIIEFVDDKVHDTILCEIASYCFAQNFIGQSKQIFRVSNLSDLTHVLGAKKNCLIFF